MHARTQLHESTRSCTAGAGVRTSVATVALTFTTKKTTKTTTV